MIKKCVIFLLFLSSFRFAFAQVPRTISYQGRLSDASGEPLSGAINITFKLYTSETASSPIWTETHNNVQIQNGLYSVMLGSVTQLPPSVDFSRPYWLGVQVGSDPEMTPRYRLGASPYALNFADTIITGSNRKVIISRAAYGFHVIDTVGTAVVGFTHSTTSYHAGVYGFAGAGSNASGVRGISYGSGYGVYAAYGPTTTTSAGLASATHAGYFNGKVEITDTLKALHIAIRETLQYVISFADFSPLGSGIEFSRPGKVVLQYSLPGYVLFYAPVHLPQGAFITKMVAYWYDNDPSHDLTIALCRNYYQVSGLESTIGTTYSSGSSGVGSSVVSINHAVDYNDSGSQTGISYTIKVQYPAGINTETGIRCVKLYYIIR